MTRLSGEGDDIRIMLYAPHFSEYVLRLAEALATTSSVLVLVDTTNLRMECTASLLRRVERTVTIVRLDLYAATPLALFRKWVLVPIRVRRFRPHIVHVQENGENYSARLFRRLRRSYPVALTVHDPQPHSGSDMGLATRTSRNLAPARSGADGFHVHGAYCESLLRLSRTIDRPVVSTPHGVLLVPDDSASAARRPATLLFFGRMEAYKGLDVLLDAVELLRNRGCAFHLTIAGRGPDLARHVVRIRANASIDVIDAFLAPQEVTRLFQRSSIVVAPYRDATQSGVIAAAFGNGRPVVASRVGGLAEAVTDGVDGVLVPPNDADALADALEPLLRDDDKVKVLMSGAVRQAETNLGWESVARDLKAFYRLILARRVISSSASPPRTGRHRPAARGAKG